MLKIFYVGGQNLLKSANFFGVSVLKAALYIYLSRVLCLSYSCHIPVCRSCGTLSYSLCFSKQTDQEDETEGFEREGLEMER